MARRFDDVITLVDPYVFVLTDLISAAALPNPTPTEDPMPTREPLFMDGDDYAGDTTTTGVIVIDGASVSGRYEIANDKDWFAFNAVAGEAISFAVTNASLGFRDVRFAISTEASGATAISYNDAANSRVDFTTDITGLYYLSMEGTHTTADGSGDYTITATTLVDDYAADNSTTGVLENDGTVLTGSFLTGEDIDWIAVTVEAGDQIEFRMTTPDSSQIPIALLVDESNPGAYLQTNVTFANAGERMFEYIFDTAGTYYLELFNGSDFTINQPYTLSATVIRADDYSNDTTTTAALSFGENFSGALDFSGDIDWIAFEGVAGTAVTFEKNTSDIRFLAMSLYDKDGNFISKSLSRDFSVFIETTETYYLAVSSDDETGNYALTSVLQTDDFGNAPGTATDYTIGRAASLDGEINYLGDDDMFAFEIVEGEQAIFFVSPGEGGELVFDSFFATILTEDYTIGTAGEPLVEFSSRLADGTYIIQTREGLAPGTYYLLLENPYTLGGGENDDYVLGSRRIWDGDRTTDRILGSELNDEISASGENDIIFGLGGSDVLYGSDGDDFIYGDAAIGLTGLEGQLYRAYQSVFNRAPDAEGFGLYLREMLAGNQDQVDVVTQFVASAEFVQTYGELSTVDFVALLFANVLPDNTDPVGPQNYVNEIEAGNLTRTEMVIDLTNTAEFVARMNGVSAAFGNNVILNPAESAVYRIYQAVFNREPDFGGFTAYVNSLRSDTLSVAEITAEFVESDEFQQSYGELDNANFVELLYQNVLPGNNDAVGRAAFTAALDAGALDRAGVVVDFAQSLELRDATALSAATFVAEIFVDDNDFLFGDAGVDTLFGGRGVDRFNYDTATSDIDYVMDFTCGIDVLRVTDAGSLVAYADILIAAGQDGSDARFDFGEGHVLVLVNVSLEDLSETDFGFQPPIGQVPRDEVDDSQWIDAAAWDGFVDDGGIG